MYIFRLSFINYDIKDKRNNWIGIKSDEKGEI